MDKKKTAASSPAITANSALQLPVDKFYAQVDDLKEEMESKISSSVSTENPSPQPPDPEPLVDQLYTQVGKEKSKEKEVCAEESGAVYSVVNKPSPPQLPAKSQQLMEELM